MTDEPQTPIAPAAPDADLPDADHSDAPPPAEPEPSGPRPARPGPPLPPPTRREPSSADVRPRRPDYRGEELDPERGPGLGCFWFQVIVLGFFIVIIPVGLNLNWPFELLALLLFVVIGLLLLTGQTVIFLLRLVAADRRSQGRRRPLASTTKTVGELEDELGPVDAGPGDAGPAGDLVAAAGEASPEVEAPAEGAGATEIAAPAEEGESPDGATSAPPPTPGGVVAAAGMIPASATGEVAPEGDSATGEVDGRAEGAAGQESVAAPDASDDLDEGATELRPGPLDDPSADPGPESFRATEGAPGSRGPQAPDEAARPEPDAALASHEPEPDEPQEPDPGVRQ